MGVPLNEKPDAYCPRSDGRNLVEEWKEERERRGESVAYVTSTRELQNVDLNSTDFLLGE